MRRDILVKYMFSCFIFLGLFVTLLLVRISLNAQTTSKVEVIEELGTNGTINWTSKVVRVKGNGYGPESVKELGRRKILAKRAAQLDAYRNLLEAVKGVHVTSFINIENMMRESNTVRTQIVGMVKGMRLVEVVYSNDGSCEVTVEVNLDEHGNFLIASLEGGDIKVTDNYPKFDWAAQREELDKVRADYARLKMEIQEKEPDKPGDIYRGIEKKNDPIKAPKAKELPFNPVTANKDYTGLLVDARDFNLKPALAPAILNEKQEKMYGIGALPSKISNGAIVSYRFGTIEKAKKFIEIGDNPLVVKCIKQVNQSDIMLSTEDARKVMYINELLEKKKVVILLPESLESICSILQFNIQEEHPCRTI